MSRHQFRLLVVLNQFFLFGVYLVQNVTDRSLSLELQDFLGVDASVFESRLGEAFYSWDWLYLYSLSLDFVTLTAAIGLCLERAWGRRLYLACFILDLLAVPLVPFYANTGWTVLISSLYGMTEGMILALAYFSHLSRMFERVEPSAEEAA